MEPKKKRTTIKKTPSIKDLNSFWKFCFQMAREMDLLQENQKAIEANQKKIIELLEAVNAEYTHIRNFERKFFKDMNGS